MSGTIAEVSAFLAEVRAELPELFEERGPEERFRSRCEHYGSEMGLDYGRVRVKEMSSLWGSCSARGDLSFNLRLLDAPPEVLDYVVVHELAHRRWRGHGARFWTLVGRHCPEHRAHRRWLRLNGPRLLRTPA